VTLRRARLCDGAEKTRAGFDLHEKSHLFQRSRRAGVGLALGIDAVCFRWGCKKPFPLNPRFLSKFRSCPFRVS
jgi:hypothetical protein